MLRIHGSTCDHFFSTEATIIVMLGLQAYLLMNRHLPIATEQWLHWSSSLLSLISTSVFAPAEIMSRSSKLNYFKPLACTTISRMLDIVIAMTCYSLYNQEVQIFIYTFLCTKLAHSSKEIIDRRLPLELIRNFLNNWKHNTWLHKVVFICLLDIATYVLY